MHGYKYPAHWATAQKTQRLDHRQLWGQESTEQNRTSKVSVRFLLKFNCLCGTVTDSGYRSAQMLCSRCALPFLALYLLLEEISAAVLPSRFRDRRVGLYAKTSAFGLIKQLQELKECYAVCLSFYNLIVVLRKLTGRTKSSSPTWLTAQTRETSLWVTLGRWAGTWTAAPLTQRLSSPQRRTFLSNASVTTRTSTSTSTSVKPMKRGEG